MPDYRYCGQRVRSSRPLDELRAMAMPASGDADWTCQPAAIPDPVADLRTWEQEDGSEWLRIGRSSNGFVLDFIAGARFHVTASRISWEAPGLPSDTVHHLLLDQVLPLALSTVGRFPVHASCVALDDRALLFAGPSGQGKSTLAAALASRGWRTLADDCAVLHQQGDDWLVSPAYPGARLWPDAAARLGVEAPGTTPVAHYTSKIRVPGVGDAPGRIRLLRLYLLEWAVGAPRVRPGGAASPIDLLRGVFRLDVADRAGMHRDFDQACALARAGYMRRLVIPRSLDALDRVLSTVLEDVAGPVVGVEECA